MELSFFLKGIILGFSIAAPVGPIGILCIRRTLQFGRLSGLFTGLGAAAADILFGAVGAFGLTFISDFLQDHQIWLRLLGGIFLLYLGVTIFLTKTTDHLGKVTHRSFLGDFVSTFFLTLGNPAAILSYLAVFAGFGFAVGSTYGSATAIVIGVGIGSALWWLLLSEGISLFRKRVTRSMMRWINRFAGLLIFTFGALSILSAFLL